MMQSTGKQPTGKQPTGKQPTGLLLAIAIALPAHADRYFRGTPNAWQTTEMTQDRQGFLHTCQVFAQGDQNGEPRFKIDRFGDWSEAYPFSDYRVQGNQAYRIRFDPNARQITVDPVVNCDPAPDDRPTFSAHFPSLFFRGTPNEWGLTPMDLVADHLWEATIFFDGRVNQRFKVDVEGDWSHNYGDSNGDQRLERTGADILSSVTGDYRVQVNDTTLTYQLISTDGSTPTPIPTPTPSPSPNPSPKPTPPPSGNVDFREESIYFLLTARFYDGDSSNNYYNRDRIKLGDPHWRGDFKGLIQQLDYIQDLGFTAIWITPPVENRSGLDYHGYHAYDFYKVDPRLESEDASYQDFIDAAHAKGIKVIQDVVINHSSQYGIRDQVWIDHLPIKYYVPQGASQGQIQNNPYFGNLGDYQSMNRDDNDNSAAPSWFRDRHNTDPEGLIPLVDPQTGVTVPSPGYNPNRFFGIDAFTLDANWYHLNGFMAGGDWENPQALQTKHLAGDTIDLATGRQNVKAYLNGAIRQYLDMGVDAIRLDTAKHIERNELLTYVNNWKTHKPNLFVFGEALVKGTGLGSELANDNASAVIRPWWYTRTTNDPANPNAGGDSGLSVLDFSLFSTFRDNVTRGSFGGIGGMLGWDWIYGDATQLVTFFQNHDVGPDNDFKYRYGGDEANAAMAYNLLWTIRGIPTLYYGEEVMFQAGLPQDIASNNDTVDQTGRAYFGLHLDNRSQTQSHPLYQHIKRLNQIRHAVPALQKAPMSQVNEWGSGMSFVRDYPQQNSYAVVGLASGAEQSITVSNIKNGRYVDLVTGRAVSVNNSQLRFTVKPYSAGIYVLNGVGQIGRAGQYLR